MPPKGYKKQKEEDPIPQSEKKIEVVKPTKTKDDLGPVTKSVPDTSNYVRVIVSWKDAKGRPRTTQYVMADLSLNEGIYEEFKDAHKTTRIHLSLDGSVLEKS